MNVVVVVVFVCCFYLLLSSLLSYSSRYAEDINKYYYYYYYYYYSVDSRLLKSADFDGKMLTTCLPRVLDHEILENCFCDIDY